jgi:hypothetical protein
MCSIRDVAPPHRARSGGLGALTDRLLAIAMQAKTRRRFRAAIKEMQQMELVKTHIQLETQVS